MGMKIRHRKIRGPIVPMAPRVSRGDKHACYLHTNLCKTSAMQTARKRRCIVPS